MQPVAFPRSVRLVSRLGCAPRSCVPCHASRGRPASGSWRERPRRSRKGNPSACPDLRPTREGVATVRSVRATAPPIAPDVLRPWAIRPDLRRTSGPWCVPSANCPPQGATVRTLPSTFAAFWPVRAGLLPPLRRAASAPSVRLVGRSPCLALLCRLWRVPQPDVSSNPPRPISRQPFAVRLIERERPRRSRPDVPRPWAIRPDLRQTVRGNP